ncbi:type II secretion system secretin GspD [Polyangium spumosum]|uniref:Type II secretion system protein GspD n=1 Tax=Polyangium spumosum TaxID=889282 RepID=A0A6N7PZ10_9BACT|nr:type II secretion system secretin GspD [Polyangium spumosum]MRG93951.1 type II secretion system protein GspD [Polyangium spumosum]
MKTPYGNSRLGRFGFGFAALLCASAPAIASAQNGPPRGAPVLKTPGARPQLGQAQGAPGAGGPNAGAPAGFPPGPPPRAGAPLGPPPVVGEDPMAGVKQGPKEIDFKPKRGNFMVSFNLEEADLNELVKAISNITGRRFIYGGKLRQIKATVYSPDKVSVQEAYSAFLSILETNGLTVIPHGRFLKIVETPGVVTQTTPIYGAGTAVPAEDRFITRMYRVSNVDSNEAANVLGKFKSKEGDITVHPSGNLIIMTDTGSNVQRMIRILEDIDVGGAGDQIWFEPIHYAGANDVAMKLNEILDLKPGAGGKPGAKGGGGGGGARILADDRTNSLVITANQPDYMRLLELIKRMDVPQSGDGQMHVLPLQHAGCKDLSGTLNQLLGGATGGGAAPGGRRGAQAAPPVPGSTEDIFEGQVKITCDEGSNKLVVTSSLRDYAALRSVIDELDQPRRQVFIEAVIMDVNVDRTQDVGVRWHMGAPVPSPVEVDGVTGDGIMYGGNDPLTSAGAPLSVANQLGAFALGVRGPTIAESANLLGTGISIPAFGVIMHAMATDSDSNVLATPHILATDNIPATIEIGQNIPLQTNVGGSLGALAGAAGGAGGAMGGMGGMGGLGLLGGLGGFAAPRQDVGTKIEVTPHVNDSDQVRLEITEGISEAGAPQGQLGAIPIIKRQAKTTLVVRDQQTVVIGGLMRDAVTNSRTKIPILGDIPVLGALFRTTKKTTQKTNLLLVLTPYIIRDQEDLRAIFERKMQERQEFLDRYFVFGDSEWEPPKDYARANGLVEDIRQSQIKMADRARLEEEARPKGPRSHEPGQPIAVPSIAVRGDDGGGAVQAMPPPTTGNAPAAPVPRRRPAGAPARPVQRVE